MPANAYLLDLDAVEAWPAAPLAQRRARSLPERIPLCVVPQDPRAPRTLRVRRERSRYGIRLEVVEVIACLLEGGLQRERMLKGSPRLPSAREVSAGDAT